MKLVNAKVFINGEFVDGGIEFDEKIIAVGSEVTGEGVDCQGGYIIPGFVDIHSHAAVDCDASDGEVEGLLKMSKYYAARGTTSWCPTTMTLGEDTLMKAMESAVQFVRPENGAKIAGINLEGPFVNPEKRGAQNGDFIKDPDIEMFKKLYEASNGLVKLITIAPEMPGSMEFIKEASKYAVVSLGHTDTDYDTAMEAYKSGASHTTHLYNAMPGIHHRKPGLIPAALDAGATIELIVDGFHSHPAIVRMTEKLFKDKLILISDSARCAGMPDGEYELGGQPIEMKNGKAVLLGTDTLAGSTIHMMDAFLRSIKFGISMENAVEAATLRPAKVIKMDDKIGSLDAGKCADIILLSPELELKAVYVDGGLIK